MMIGWRVRCDLAFYGIRSGNQSPSIARRIEDDAAHVPASRSLSFRTRTAPLPSIAINARSERGSTPDPATTAHGRAETWAATFAFFDRTLKKKMVALADGFKQIRARAGRRTSSSAPNGEPTVGSLIRS
jgi:hypothetical protein